MKLQRFFTSRLSLKKYSAFLIKFFFFSTALYFIWAVIASAYFSLVLKLTATYFELIGMEIALNPTSEYLYSQGIRSCIPPFIALILASNFLFQRKFDQRKSRYLSLSLEGKSILRGLIIGIPILFFFRVILQISYVYLQISPAPGEFYSIFVIFLSGTCRVALPFLLWLALTYKQIFPLLKPEEYTKGKSGLGDKTGYI